MSFKKYQHVERWGNTEVEGIELGTCWVFPKLDGTNASVWYDGDVRYGSRRREITPEYDNAGFAKWACTDFLVRKFLYDNPSVRLFGEWLVPHSLKTYRDEAWGRFYIFDVILDGRYLPYEQYLPILYHYEGLDIIRPIAVIKNGSYEQFIKLLDQNTYMMQDGHRGEGIVIKNYERGAPWAKIVTSEFKEKHVKAMGPAEIKGKSLVEQHIAEEFVTRALCEKVKSKIEVAEGSWSSRLIPRLLQTVYYDLVNEDTWEFVKKHKNPAVDFKVLNKMVSIRVKKLLPEVF